MKSLQTTVATPMPDAEEAVRHALAEQGFGVLTEIDVAATLKSKLGVERPALKILGACNPALAHQALTIEPTASLLLPCNVVLEPSEDGGTVISIVDPRELMGDDRLASLADDAATRLQAALDTVSLDPVGR